MKIVNDFTQAIDNYKKYTSEQISEERAKLLADSQNTANKINEAFGTNIAVNYR